MAVEERQLYYEEQVVQQRSRIFLQESFQLLHYKSYGPIEAAPGCILAVKVTATARERLAQVLNVDRKKQPRLSIMLRFPNDRVIAAKVYITSNNAQLAWQWDNERSIMARIKHHDNIVDYLGSYTDSATFSVVFTELYGCCLFKLNIQPPFRFSEIYGVFQQIGRALIYLHQLGIGHCDVRLSNVVVGQNRKLKLTNFGHARIATREERQRATKSGAVPVDQNLFVAKEGQNPILKDSLDFAHMVIGMIFSDAQHFYNWQPKQDDVVMNGFKQVLVRLCQLKEGERTTVAAAILFMRRIYPIDVSLGERIIFRAPWGDDEAVRFMPRALSVLQGKDYQAAAKILTNSKFQLKVKPGQESRFVGAVANLDTYQMFVETRKTLKPGRMARIFRHTKMHNGRVTVHINLTINQLEFGHLFRAAGFLARNRHTNIIAQYWTFWESSTSQTSSQQTPQQPKSKLPFPIYFFTIVEYHGLSLAALAPKLFFGNNELATILKRIGSALIYLHRQGWVHKQIKAENVVTMYDGEAVDLNRPRFCDSPMKLIDFSFATKLNDRGGKLYEESNQYSFEKLAALTKGGAYMTQGKARKNAYLKDSYYFGMMLKTLALSHKSAKEKDATANRELFAEKFMALPLNDVLKLVIDRMACSFSITIKAGYEFFKRRAGFDNFHYEAVTSKPRAFN